MAAAGSKIALGTVQFGLPYGISNSRGQVPTPEVCAILDFCAQHQIFKIDTAAAYGSSEAVLGSCLPATSHPFKIISKLPAACIPGEVEAQVRNSLAQLQTKSLYGYLFHDFKTYQKHPGTLDEIFNLKEKGMIGQVGFSLYYPQQLEYLFEKDIQFEIIQIPFNVFDQRFAYLFSTLQERNIQVHVRSVFLQGLLLTPSERVNSYFKPLLPALTRLHQIAYYNNIPLTHLLLGFAHIFPAVTNLVIGVTQLADLETNVNYINYLPTVKDNLAELLALALTDEAFLLPFNWKIN